MGKSPETVKRWIRESRLTGEKIAGKWHVVVDDTFEQYLNSNDMPNEHHLNVENRLQRELISKMEQQIAVKDKQIESMSQQTDHLSQLLAVAHKSLQQVSEQYQQLEDKRNQPSFFQRLRARFAS